MTWPSPPRYCPGPPESATYSFRQKINGATVSVISTGVLRTPEGNAVAESPSLPGRAPVPPVWKGFTTNGAESR